MMGCASCGGGVRRRPSAQAPAPTRGYWFVVDGEDTLTGRFRSETAATSKMFELCGATVDCTLTVVFREV